MSDGLVAFRQGIEQALQQAGYPVTEANVQKAIQIWNKVNPQGTMSRADFVAALRYSLTAGGAPPVMGPAVTPPTSLPVQVQPGLTQQNWVRAQDQVLHIAELEAQGAQDIANLAASTDRYIADMSASVQRELASGNISSNQAIAAMQIASAEAMQAKQLALDRLISDRNYEINQAQLQLQELEYKAGLAANPADWLTYQAFLGGGQLPRVGAGATATQQAAAGTIAGTAEGLYAGGQPLYNPALSGVGVAGARVPGPQEVSHQTLLNMTPTEQAMFQGFLQAGIEVAPGRNVAINPEDWLAQAQRGFVPGVSEASFVPQYNY